MEKHSPISRFQEFNVNWSASPASDIFVVETDKGHPELPVLSASQELGMIKRDNIGINMQYSKQNIASYKRVQPGRFVIHLRSFQGGFAHSAIEGITSPAYTVLSLREPQKHDDHFWKYLLTSPEFIKRLELVTYGIRDGRSISVEDFFELPFCYPSTQKEQHKIAQLFSRLDTLIAAEDKKLSRLKNIKSASLEKMFPKLGETTPQVRFKEFSGEWEDVCFKDVSYPAGTKNKDNLPLESYSISNEFGFIPQNDKFENGGTMANADKRLYYIVTPDSFAYNPARINVGSIGYDNLDKDVIISSLYVVFKTDKDTYNPFLKYWFKTSTFQKMIELYQEGGVRLYFFYDKLCNCHFRRPLLEEQKRISSFFSRLDTLISAQEQKLDKLRSLKKSYLEYMLVNVQN